MHALISRVSGRFSLQENTFRFSWPVLSCVLLIHAALLLWLAKGQAPAAPAVTPPIIGILISPPSTPGSGALAGEHLPIPAKAGQKLQQKQPNQPVPTRSHEKQQAHSPSGKTTKAITTNEASPQNASGENGRTQQAHGTRTGSGTGAFFSPRIDAAFANNPKPPYPAVSRRMGEEGMVILSVHILATGQVAEIRLKKSSGYPRLDNAAMSTVKKWRYLPARQGNTPIPFWHTQAIRFSLTD